MELLETSKFSIKGILEALTKGIFDQGYIQIRLAILERLVEHILSEKENVSVF